MPCVRSATRSGTAGVDAIREFSERFDGVEQSTTSRCPRAALTGGARPSSTPTIRAGLEESIRRLRATCEAELEHDVVTELGARRPGDPPQGAGRPRRPLRPRRPRPAGLQRGDERRARRRPPGVASIALAARRRRSTAGCRTPRSWPRARCSGSTRSTPSAAPRRSPCSPTAPARAAGSTWSPARQHLHGHGQAAAQGRGRHRLRGRPDRDRDPGRRHRRPGVRRRRPDQPGRARPAGRRRAGHRRRSGSPTRSRPSSTSRSRRPGTPSGSAPRCPARQSGIVLVDDLEQGLAVVDAYAAEHLEIQTADAAARAPPGSATPARSSSAPTRRCRWATTAPAPTTCCPPPAAPATPRGCRCARSSRPCTSSTTPARALAEVADHVVTLAEAEDLPGHGAAVRVRFELTRVTAARLRAARRPCARSCAASSRTAPRSSTSPSSSTSTRTPTGPRPPAWPTSRPRWPRPPAR